MISVNKAPREASTMSNNPFLHYPASSEPRNMPVYFVTLHVFYVSFVQQTVQHLVWRLADSITDKKTRNTVVSLFWNGIWKAGCQNGWELFTHHCSPLQFFSSRRGKKHVGDVLHTPHSNARFLQISKFTCISVPGVICFKAFPLSCMSLASDDLGVEHFFCFLALDCGHCLCKLLVFPVILIFPAALCLLQCLAYCSEQ